MLKIVDEFDQLVAHFGSVAQISDDRTVADDGVDEPYDGLLVLITNGQHIVCNGISGGL